MGMFDIFTNTQPTNAAPAAPVVPGNLPPDAGVTDPNNPHVPPAPVVAVPATPPEPESPLSQFEKLWEPIPTDPNAPTPTAPQELNAEDVQKAVAKANFTQAITPEQLAAIGQGGEAAQTAFTEAMNAVAQQVMVQATLVGNKLTDKAVSSALEAQKLELPQMLREQATTAHLSDTNPVFDNPAVKPVVESTKAQLLQKFPNATPTEITQMTQDFILAMGEAFTPKAPELADGEQDWNKFLGQDYPFFYLCSNAAEY